MTYSLAAVSIGPSRPACPGLSAMAASRWRGVQMMDELGPGYHHGRPAGAG